MEQDEASMTRNGAGRTASCDPRRRASSDRCRVDRRRLAGGSSGASAAAVKPAAERPARTLHRQRLDARDAGDAGQGATVAGEEAVECP